ncbi:MAG: PKD domain-containing protein [Candidatus Woesearchaeota archaeon]|nr:PKD domain-containing protein [Candidatus Woesearchaeota archaeon]
MRKALLFLGIALISLALFEALLLTGPDWAPSTAFTNDTLNCTWTNSTDTTAQNITIYNGSSVYNTTYENASLVNLSATAVVAASETRKGETWICSITLYNDTASTQSNASITITNSIPTAEEPPGGIFNESSADVGFLVQIAEDSNITIDANATDADGDTITYLLTDEFCTRLSSTEGTYACAPTFSDLSNNQPTEVNITFSFDDGQNVGGRKITFNVTPVNDEPTATLADQTTAVNASLNYTFTAADEESHYPLNVSLIAPAEVSDKLSIAALNANGTSVSIFYDGSFPDFSDVGLHTITVNVTDNQSLSGLYNFTLNITAVGRVPYFTNVTDAGPYNITQDEFIQINITANDLDANTTIVFTDDSTSLAIVTVTSETNASDAFGQINFTPTNDDVGIYNVTITITDAESLTNTTILEFNVTNVNDAPVVNELSFSSENTQNNQNSSNLTGYANALFIYDVNATDIDVIHGDTLNYTDNTTLFDIDLTTGRINFTPNNTDVGVYSINITATDTAGVADSRVLTLTVNANSPPFFNATLPQLNCTTKALCAFDLGLYTDDPDAGDNISLFAIAFNGSNISTFAFNETTGLINFTTVKTDIGNYTINITITDGFGATNSSEMNISINNTPETPNITRYNFSNETIVETHTFAFELQAEDDDFLVVGEVVNFTSNFSLPHTISALAAVNTTARALFTFTPADGTAGSYTISINATDAFGLVGQQVFTFDILADVPPPNISQITPWSNTSGLQTTFRNTTDAEFSSGSATVDMQENTTVNFSTVVIDTQPVTYVWTVNGTQVATSENYTRTFDFFSAAEYEIVVNVSNDRLESSRFTWNVNVSNVNRLPELQTNLSDLSVNGTLTDQDYFTIGPSNTNRFFDPDDDLDSNGTIDGNENNSLMFELNDACSVATVAISGADITVTGTAVGSCNVTFNATDTAGETLESNTITIDITEVTEGESETVTTTSSSGGGGSGSSAATFIPITNQRTKPEAFKLIAPKLITVYENDSLTIPIVINNTWRDKLKHVQLDVLTNDSVMTTSFDTNFFEEIPKNETREVLLTVENYRLGENYEIVVRANVSEPVYEDEAIILLNSLEQAHDGDDVDVKVTFANDLLNQHPECQELNEVLSVAKKNLQERNIEMARLLVDNVINGCKYLVSTQQRIEEKPSKIKPVITIESLSLRTLMWSLLAFVLLVSVAFLLYYHYSYKPEEDI